MPAGPNEPRPATSRREVITPPLSASARLGVELERGLRAQQTGQSPVSRQWHAGSVAEEAIFLTQIQQGLQFLGYVEGPSQPIASIMLGGRSASSSIRWRRSSGPVHAAFAPRTPERRGSRCPRSKSLSDFAFGRQRDHQRRGDIGSVAPCADSFSCAATLEGVKCRPEEN